MGSPWAWSVFPGAGSVTEGANSQERAYLSSFTIQDVDVVEAEPTSSSAHNAATALTWVAISIPACPPPMARWSGCTSSSRG